MSSILLLWIGLAVWFIIIELLTATFYGLSLALASSVVAAYVFVIQENDFQMMQAVIFVIGSAIFAYFLPKYLVSRSPDMPQGMEKYIGEKRTAKKVWSDFKISLDGVDYLIESDDDISAGAKVEIIGHKWASMKVKSIQ